MVPDTLESNPPRKWSISSNDKWTKSPGLFEIFVLGSSIGHPLHGHYLFRGPIYCASHAHVYYMGTRAFLIHKFIGFGGNGTGARCWRVFLLLMSAPPHLVPPVVITTSCTTMHHLFYQVMGKQHRSLQPDLYMATLDMHRDIYHSWPLCHHQVESRPWTLTASALSPAVHWCTSCPVSMSMPHAPALHSD
jgi:hypothetical protein